MTPKYILAIDQGTTNTKAVLFDTAGQVVSQSAVAPQVSYPQPAWVEQDGLEIWYSVQQAVDGCLEQSPAADLAAVAVTNQRETVVLWERSSGKPLAPCIVWQCHRTAPFCAELRQRGLEQRIRQLTGLQIDPMFSASKMRWLLDHTPNGHQRAAAGELCLGTIDSWITWNLTAGKVHVCDATNAARTQLMNLNTLNWDPELLEIFGIPEAALPTLSSSSRVVGKTAGQGRLPEGVPIASLIGDSHAALYGHTGFQTGTVKATYGTGSSLMTPTNGLVYSERGLSTTLAWVRSEPTYALEGNIYATGAAVQWLGNLLMLADEAQGVEKLAWQVQDAGGVYFIPAFVGLGAPHWDEDARGLISGLTRGISASHLARATLESIAYQIRDVFDVMAEESGSGLNTLQVDGGATRNDLLMQFQADILNVPVVRSLSGDISALGAAYLAGLAVGVWQSETQIATLNRPVERFEPKITNDQRQKLYSGWQVALQRAMSRH